MADVLIVQHAPGEGPGLLGESLAAAGLATQIVHPCLGESIPTALGAARALVVLGGAMSVTALDAAPYLYEELKLIEAALRAGRPVLGLCLGSQLLAHALGARVSRAPQLELGWFAVRLTEAARIDALLAGAPDQFTAFHWHEDTFDLPAGAVRLAESDLCRNQAYRFGTNAYGIQFHPEVDQGVLAAMADGGDAALREAVLGPAPRELPRWQPIARRLFDAWAQLVLTG